jgi:hypothetical protein
MEKIRNNCTKKGTNINTLLSELLVAHVMFCTVTKSHVFRIQLSSPVKLLTDLVGRVDVWTNESVTLCSHWTYNLLIRSNDNQRGKQIFELLQC